MKPTFFFLCLLVSSFGFSAFAQKATTFHKASKEIHFKEIFNSVSVEDDMEIVLTEGKSDKISVDGDVVATIADSQLYLAARNPQMAHVIKVYVPADYLSKIYMQGNGFLYSNTILSNQKMRIILSAEAKINVRSMGNVTVEPMNDIVFVRSR
jgi:hypothetical protein